LEFVRRKLGSESVKTQFSKIYFSQIYFLTAMNSHACLSGASLADTHITGYVSYRACISLDVHLLGRAHHRHVSHGRAPWRHAGILWACISETCILSIGMHLMDVNLRGMHLIGVHLPGVYLIGVHLLGRVHHRHISHRRAPRRHAGILWACISETCIL
jgi:hypothetical protein